MPRPLEDYALVGDGNTVALIARDGAVDWLCWPRFDSDTCFAALLGSEENGRWRIGPADPDARTERRYRGDTLVLETRFATGSGAARLIDFMPDSPDGTSVLVRLLEGLEGEVELTFDIRLRFDYGSIRPWVQSSPDDGAVIGISGPHLAVLRADLPLDPTQPGLARRFTVKAGESLTFTLQYGPSHLPSPPPIDARRALADTEQHWQAWTDRFSKPTDWPEAVRRSLITLKALMHRPTGGLVAAPTLGLPEKPGGSMNWDYRYCWLRDSTFTLITFLNAGYPDAAQAWQDWLLRAVAGQPEKLRIMYRLDGSRRLEEWNVPWLAGYEGAQPVRVGNAAAGQLQLDVFGEVLDALHLAERCGIKRTRPGIEVEADLIAHLEQVWRQPDQGLWESRDRPQHYVYSKAMCWVAFDRFVRGETTRARTDAATLARIEALRDEVHAQVCREGFSERRNSFADYYGAHHVDASLLLLPLIGFLPVSDPRMAGTIAAVERELMEGGLVRRHRAPLLGQEEGAFIACSCWLVQCMGMQGRRGEASALLERVLALRNDVGLLSEEYHLPSRRLMGNFPQALSHLALVNAALALCGPVLQRSG